MKFSLKDCLRVPAQRYTFSLFQALTMEQTWEKKEVNQEKALMRGRGRIARDQEREKKLKRAKPFWIAALNSQSHASIQYFSQKYLAFTVETQHRTIEQSLVQYFRPPRMTWPNGFTNISKKTFPDVVHLIVYVCREKERENIDE